MKKEKIILIFALLLCGWSSHSQSEASLNSIDKTKTKQAGKKLKKELDLGKGEIQWERLYQWSEGRTRSSRANAISMIEANYGTRSSLGYSNYSLGSIASAGPSQHIDIVWYYRFHYNGFIYQGTTGGTRSKIGRVKRSVDKIERKRKTDEWSTNDPRRYGYDTQADWDYAKQFDQNGRKKSVD